MSAKSGINVDARPPSAGVSPAVSHAPPLPNRPKNDGKIYAYNTQAVFNHLAGFCTLIQKLQITSLKKTLGVDIKKLLAYSCTFTLLSKILSIL